MSVNDRFYGTVKWYNPEKGYGFLRRDDGQEDVFVHVSAVRAAGFEDLNDGAKVSFEIEVNKRNNKTCAIKLELQ